LHYGRVRQKGLHDRDIIGSVDDRVDPEERHVGRRWRVAVELGEECRGTGSYTSGKPLSERRKGHLKARLSGWDRTRGARLEIPCSCDEQRFDPEPCKRRQAGGHFALGGPLRKDGLYAQRKSFSFGKGLGRGEARRVWSVAMDPKDEPSGDLRKGKSLWYREVFR
jgi:hypothetical protein